MFLDDAKSSHSLFFVTLLEVKTQKLQHLMRDVPIRSLSLFCLTIALVKTFFDAFPLESGVLAVCQRCTQSLGEYSCEDRAFGGDGSCVGFQSE